MRSTRSSTLQTPGAKTSGGCASIRSLTPQVRKEPPSNCPKASKRTRKSTSSLTPQAVSHIEQCTSKTLDRDVHSPPQHIISTFLPRETGARKSRQNGRLNNQLSSSLTTVLKDSSVSVNSTRGNSSTKSPANTPSSTHEAKTKSNSNDSTFSSNKIQSQGKKGSKQSPRDASNDEDSEYYDVEDILDLKLEKGRYYYLIKWKGYPHSANTWEPENHVPRDLLDFYFESKQGKSKGTAEDSQSEESDHCHESNCNGENSLNSSHSRTRIDVQGSKRYESASISRSPSSSPNIIPANETATNRLRINRSPETSSSSSSTSSFKNAHHRARRITEADDCLNYSSFQANSPPESNGSVTTDSPQYSSTVQNDHLMAKSATDFDPLSLRNLKLFIHDKPSSSSSSESISSLQCCFELNDSLVPGKIVSIDNSPFGTGKVALIKWLNHEPTAWLDYDFVKLKYPDLLAEFCEAIHVVDTILPDP